jgi:hypothetical protein
MSNLSRRMRVSGAAALPALAVLAIAVADPVFAAIEAHQRAKETAAKSKAYLDTLHSIHEQARVLVKHTEDHVLGYAG